MVEEIHKKYRRTRKDHVERMVGARIRDYQYLMKKFLKQAWEPLQKFLWIPF